MILAGGGPWGRAVRSTRGEGREELVRREGKDSASQRGPSVREPQMGGVLNGPDKHARDTPGDKGVKEMSRYM